LKSDGEGECRRHRRKKAAGFYKWGGEDKRDGDVASVGREKGSGKRLCQRLDGQDGKWGSTAR